MSGTCGLFFTTYRAEDAVFPGRFQKLCLAAFFVALAACPLFLNTYHLSILNLMGIAVIAAVSLNLLTGVCGQISLGHGAFLGVGAYAAALAVKSGLPFLLALLAGGGATAVVGMVFGLPSLRLKGIYLAIATLAAQLILEYLFLHWDAVTGGLAGVAVPPPEILGFQFMGDERMFYLIMGAAVLCALAVRNLLRTRPGRAFVAIRDYYLSAEIVGVNLFAWKLRAFGLSSFLAGIAGGLWGHYTMYITPEQFGIGQSISFLAMIVIGGLGSVQGAVFGAIFLTLLPEFLSAAAGGLSDVFPDMANYFLAMKEGVFGLTLVLFLIFEPEGLAHRWQLVKAYWKLYPFAH